ncbi:MAG TPA: hypothetical protein VGI70_05230 [Polyangiales bacterium]|jgi:hypothetical protein
MTTALRNTRGLDHGLAAAVAIAAGLTIYPYLTWPATALIQHGLFVDDAFFYSVVARNAWLHRFLTFDGIQPTNGFQPLWMLLQVVLLKACPHVDPIVVLARSSWAAYVLFAFALSEYALRLADATPRRMLALAPVAALLLQAGFHRLVVSGLEVPLSLLLLILFLTAIERLASTPPTDQSSLRLQCVLTGLLAALTFMCRTDLFWCVPLALSVVAVKKRAGAGGARWFAWFLAPVALIVTPYLAWNYTHFDALMPISGRVKRFYLHASYPSLRAYLHSDEWHGVLSATKSALALDTWSSGALAGAVALLLLGLSFAAAVWLWRSERSSVSEKMLSVLVVLHVGYMYLFYRELRPYTSYYFSYVVVWLYLTVSRLLVELSRAPTVHGQRFAIGMIGGLVVALFVGSWRSAPFPSNELWTRRLELGRGIRQITEPGQTVGAFWPGLLAATSDRDIVPLDGIIGSESYFQNYVKAGREFDYIRARHVKYVAIYLETPIEQLIAQHEAPTGDWRSYGTLRVWQHRAAIKRVVLAEPVLSTGGAWYLLELLTPNSV